MLFRSRSIAIIVFDSIEYKGVNFLQAKGVVSYCNSSVELTKNEIKILSVLYKNAGRIVSRDELMDELWKSDEFVDDKCHDIYRPYGSPSFQNSLI